jgi:sterol desaturase/sphingolipid hydroxylase (fatty acid hydroxylase superfamily)
MITFERILPGVPLKKVPNWMQRAILLNLAQIVIVIIAGYTWNPWLQGWSLFQLNKLGLFSGSIITYIVSTFIFYWWHRIRHESKFWWKFAHQIHHSASRIEALTSFYKHPFEITLNSILSAIIVYPLMGCSTEQGAVYTIIIATGELFYHWNISTPRWLGHLLQRPESHRIHHQKSIHTKNYGDLPVFDKLFGTFSNPKNANRVKCGFQDEKEQEIMSMLACMEVETTRRSDPIEFFGVCFSCHKKHRCQKEAERHARKMTWE